MWIKRYREKDGFTLIEILIAMAIASIVLVAFFSFLNSTIMNNAKNEKDIKLVNIAQSEIEILREQIKSGTSQIKIELGNSNRISIPDSNHIKWVGSNEQILEIDSTGIYKEYIYNSNNSILEYIKKINNEDYIIRLDVSREVKNKKYLYTIHIEVKYGNEAISKRNIELKTKILSI